MTLVESINRARSLAGLPPLSELQKAQLELQEAEGADEQRSKVEASLKKAIFTLATQIRDIAHSSRKEDLKLVAEKAQIRANSVFDGLLKGPFGKSNREFIESHRESLLTAIKNIPSSGGDAILKFLNDSGWKK